MSPLEMLMHMVWPVSCPVCGAMGKLLCDPCLASLFSPQHPRCLWCGEPAPCKVHEDHARIWAGAVYGGHIKNVILALKHGRYRALGFKIGGALGRFYPGIRRSVDVLVPVPLHLHSKRRYNQAEAIADGLGRAWGIEVRNAARWTADVSTRAGSGLAERLALRSDVFDLDAQKISGLRVAFVDDVCTTGTTLSSLAKAAKQRGAEPIGAFVAAHVPPIT